MLVLLMLPVLGVGIFYTGYWLQHLPEEIDDNEFQANGVWRAGGSCPLDEPYYATQERMSEEDGFVEDEDLYDLVEKQPETDDASLGTGSTAVGIVAELEIHEIYR